MEYPDAAWERAMTVQRCSNSPKQARGSRRRRCRPRIDASSPSPRSGVSVSRNCTSFDASTSRSSRRVQQIIRFASRRAARRRAASNVIAVTKRPRRAISSGARAWPTRERSTFLIAACAGDAALREEVESLLAHEAAADGFIEEPALEVAAGLLADAAESSLVGRQIGTYRVVSVLGTGGMGVAYRADDTRLQRPVALKHVDLASSDEGRAAVLAEARLASRLNHPHICTIYEVAETEAGAILVLEYIEGQPLTALIPKEGLPLEFVLRYGSQIADAVAHAHAHGIVHGDLKSANVMVTADGRAKVLDFGLGATAACGDSRDGDAIEDGAQRQRADRGDVAVRGSGDATGRSVGRAERHLGAGGAVARDGSRGVAISRADRVRIERGDSTRRFADAAGARAGWAPGDHQALPGETAGAAPPAMTVIVPLELEELPLQI
jgi:hypothetical protein